MTIIEAKNHMFGKREVAESVANVATQRLADLEALLSHDQVVAQSVNAMMTLRAAIQDMKEVLALAYGSSLYEYLSEAKQVEIHEKRRRLGLEG